MKSAPSAAPFTAPSATPTHPTYEPKLASVAAVIVDATRARMLSYLLAGDYASAGELALMAERRTHTAAWANPTRQRLRFARCCYGHLAEQLGVELFSQLLSKEWLSPAGDGYLLTAQGTAGLGAAGPLPATRLAAPL